MGRSGRLILGQEVRSFECELAAWWEWVTWSASRAASTLEIALRCADVLYGHPIAPAALESLAAAARAIVACA